MLGGTAEAAGGPWVVHDEARVRLIAAGETTGETSNLTLGVHFRIESGWKINWRSVGDAGLATSVDWTGSENLARPELLWPLPHRFSIFGLETFGYSGEVVLPVNAQLERTGDGARLRATVSYLACQDICIPHDDVLTLDLPAGLDMPSRDALLIDRFQALVPG
ncbi:MAG: hypothetical protein AcusKO_43370 [Acuticoccus sp.]